MATTESALVLGMLPGQFTGMTPETVVSVLDRSDYLERFTQVLELGDTVLRGTVHTASDLGPVTVLSISPWGVQERQRVLDSAKRLHPQPLSGKSVLPLVANHPDGRIPRSEAEARVRTIQANGETVDTYYRRGRLGRAIQVVRFLLGKSSDYPSSSVLYNSRFPDILHLSAGRGDNYHTIEVVVSREAETRYRAATARLKQSG